MRRNRLVALAATVATLFILADAARVQAQELEPLLLRLKNSFLDLKTKQNACPLDDAYYAVARMQEICNEADQIYERGANSASGVAEERRSSDAKTHAMVHAIMKMAAAVIDYADLYELHDQLMMKSTRNAGFTNPRDLLGTESLGDQLLQERYVYWTEEYRSVRSAYKPITLTVDKSKRLDSLRKITVRAAGCNEAQRFADSLTLQLRDPIVKNAHVKYYLEDAAKVGIDILPGDYFYSPRDKSTEQWIQGKASEFLSRPVIELTSGISGQNFLVPEGEYAIFLSGAAEAANVKPSMFVRGDAEKIGIIGYRWIVQDDSFVQVDPVRLARLPVGLRKPEFEILNFSLGLERRTLNLEGAIGGRMFQRFGRNLALQTQGQFEFRTYRDELDLDQIISNLAGQPLIGSEQRGLADFGGKEFQLDVGPVTRFGPVQFAVMESLRYVKRDSFDRGGVIGQFFFNAGYLFKHGQIGIFGTKANIDQPVVKSVRFNQVFFEETYLKVTDQVGLNFQLAFPARLSGYLEGTVGYLNTTAVKGAVGGTLRYVRPVPGPDVKIAITAEVGYNEGLISSENSLRVGFGLRFGNWSRHADSGYAKENGPVPVIVPGVRYETLTRTVRRGNNKPVANAGPDLKNVDPAAVVTLDGRGSFDPDSDPITYKWIQVSPAGSVLNSTNVATPAFTAGSFGSAYVFILIVCDSLGLCSDDPNSTACPGAGNAADACVSVNVRKEPQITGFAANPISVDTGQSSTLSWSTADADHVTLGPGFGEVPISGSQVVSPVSTTKYTLTAYSGTFSVSREVAVSVRGPQVRSFTADQSVICAPGCTILRWSAGSAVRAVISPDIGEVPLEGSRQICPDRPTEYTITVFGGGTPAPAVTATVRVTVNKVPKIFDFSVQPTRIRKGETAVLSWITDGGDTVTLAPPLRTVNASGSVQVAPATTQSYDLVVRNGCSEVTRSVTVYVDPVAPLPRIITFTATPTLISEGDTVTLTWRVVDADSVTITNLQNPQRMLPTGGSLQQTLKSTTTFTLTAYSRSGSVSADVTVEVKLKAPTALLTADQSEIWSGMTARLTWSTTNAVRCDLMTNGVNPEPVLCNAWRDVRPTITTSYTLVAYNAANESTSATFVLKVKTLALKVK